MKENPQPSRRYKNSPQLLEKTFASLREAVFIIDAKTTRILNCNPAASQIFGYRKEEMLGQTTNFLHVDEERLGEFRKSLFAAVEERGSLDLPEFQMKRRDGEVFFTNHSVMPLEDDRGKRIGWVSVVRDITDGKRAEELLLKNENRLKKSQEIAHLGSWELDLVNNILTWSDEVYRIFGLQPQQFGATYEAFLEAVHPDDRIAVDAAYSGSLREGRNTYEIEHRVMRKSTGEIRYVHEKCEHVRDKTGKIIRSAGMVHDITERKRMEEELRRSRDELELRVQERTAEVYRQAELLDLTRDAIVVREMSGVITFWNDGAREMYGWTKEEALGKIGRDLLQTEFPVPQDELIAKLIQNGRWEGELTHTRKDGKKIKVLCRWTLQRGEEGKPVGVMIISHDITERLKLEEQLRQAQKLEALGTLAGGIAHDFNNLLAAIITNTETALFDVPKESDTRTSLEEAVKAGLRGRDLVKQILAFSRKSEKKEKVLRLSPLVKETSKFLRSSLPTTIEMDLHLEADSDAVCADPSQIQQVIMNLCTNAAYAMRERTGKLEIGLQSITFDSNDHLPDEEMSSGDYLVLSVKDTGSGINQEVRNRIFEPFFSTKPTGEGTGLGLSVAYGIVKNHKGGITVYSEPGRGSIFRVYLPKVDTGVSAQAEALKPIPRGDERILLVDDEELIVNSVRNMLQRLGYKVTALMDSQEALKFFSADPSQFDLVMTDQTMPFMTGEDLGKEMMRIRADIPVILCTGYADLISSEKAMAMGFRGFIMKPFTIREGAQLVRSVLDRK